MRNFIVVLSLIFFALSGLTTFKALSISSYTTPHQINREEPKPMAPLPEGEKSLKQPAREQKTNQAEVEELQATIAELENKLSNKNEEVQSVDELKDTVAWLKSELSKKDKKIQEQTGTNGAEKKSRVLAVLGAGTFRSGQVVIEKGLTDDVKGLVPEIMASPDYRVMIEGHTDNMPIRSSSEKRYKDNMELSFLRAKAVADILMKNGISLERISVIGYGDTRPVASNETYEGRVKNRRVEVKLLPADREF
jgi:flagellar motor protein MotB